MATIGLDSLYYAKITEDENGIETYGVKSTATMWWFQEAKMEEAL
jgi:hypothetical protein